MASGRVRRSSKDVPPDLSDLMDTLIEYANAFIRKFNDKQSDMRAIVRRFKELSDEVNQLDTTPNSLSFFFSSPLESIGRSVNSVYRSVIESMSANKAKSLGNEFAELIKPLKVILENIKTTCEALENKSAEALAKGALSDMEDFRAIQKRVSELARTSEGLLSVIVDVLGFIGDLVMLVVNVVRASVSAEQEEKLIASINDASDQCRKVVDGFDTMKRELSDFV